MPSIIEDNNWSEYALVRFPLSSTFYWLLNGFLFQLPGVSQLNVLEVLIFVTEKNGNCTITAITSFLSQNGKNFTSCSWHSVCKFRIDSLHSTLRLSLNCQPCLMPSTVSRDYYVGPKSIWWSLKIQILMSNISVNSKHLKFSELALVFNKVFSCGC